MACTGYRVLRGGLGGRGWLRLWMGEKEKGNLETSRHCRKSMKSSVQILQRKSRFCLHYSNLLCPHQEGTLQEQRLCCRYPTLAQAHQEGERLDPSPTGLRARPWEVPGVMLDSQEPSLGQPPGPRWASHLPQPHPPREATPLRHITHKGMYVSEVSAHLPQVTSQWAVPRGPDTRLQDSSPHCGHLASPPPGPGCRVRRPGSSQSCRKTEPGNILPDGRLCSNHRHLQLPSLSLNTNGDGELTTSTEH